MEQTIIMSLLIIIGYLIQHNMFTYLHKHQILLHRNMNIQKYVVNFNKK